MTPDERQAAVARLLRELHVRCRCGATQPPCFFCEAAETVRSLVDAAGGREPPDLEAWKAKLRQFAADSFNFKDPETWAECWEAFLRLLDELPGDLGRADTGCLRTASQSDGENDRTSPASPRAAAPECPHDFCGRTPDSDYCVECGRESGDPCHIRLGPNALNDPETEEYPVIVRAYLAMETALAKRILADWNRDRVATREWPAGQEWDGLGQTSHETLWSAARKEAGLPPESAFKNKVILGSLAGTEPQKEEGS